MKKKVLLKSAAAVMSVFTLAPCFGNVAFAMKKNKGQVVTQQVANEKEIAKNEIIKLVNTFVHQHKVDDKKELKKFRDKIKLSLMSPSDDNANIRVVIYSVILAYLIEKNYFHFEINLEAILNDKFNCCANRVRDLFVFLDTTLRIYFSDDNLVLENLASLRADLFKIDGRLQKRNYSENKSNTLKKLLENERSKMRIFDKFSNDNDRKNVQSIFKKIVPYAYGISIDNTFFYLFGLFQNGVGSSEFCKLMEKMICEQRSNSKREDLKLRQQRNAELQKLKEQFLAEFLKQQQPEVEARNAAQEKEREEERERSRNTKPNKPTGDVRFQNFDNMNHLSDEEKKEEASRKAEGRKQAKEIEKNQQKEKEKEKEKEIQKRQEEIEQLRERQKLPSDDLTDEDINRIFTEKSKGVSIKSNNYTKIFTAGEGDVKNTVYFPFVLLNKVEGNNKQQKNNRTSIKRMIYNISRLPENEFERLSLDTYTGSTLSQFLNKHFTQNARVCFTNSNPENVYRFKINNKCQVVFVKRGNEIVVLDSLEHINNGLQ